MSREIIDHSEDLQRLEREGYVLDEQGNFLYVYDVPYVTAERAIDRGVLVMPLDLAGNKTVKPSSHVAFFIGELPHTINGQKMDMVITAGPPAETKAKYYFSAKANYANYYDKVKRYCRILGDQVAAIDSSVKATTFRLLDTPAEEMVFVYRDTNASRAGISPISDKLKGHTIAIIGIGGTGSYLLDYLAKTPVATIHLFDGDSFYNNNAFRAPGAASLQTVSEELKKTDYFQSVYAQMHRYIISHPYNITTINIADLAPMDFVFLCMDSGEDKRNIVQFLEQHNIPFIETGMGVRAIDGSLKAQAKITASWPGQRSHTSNRISYEQDANNLYEQNIQIAELNSINAILAIMKWKKYLGFYHDSDKELFSCFITYFNEIINDDIPS